MILWYRASEFLRDGIPINLLTGILNFTMAAGSEIVNILENTLEYCKLEVRFKIRAIQTFWKFLLMKLNFEMRWF